MNVKGNISEDSNGEDLKEFLGSIMKEVGLSNSKLGGNPIVNIRVSPKFAFIELRSVEETSNALNMDGIPYANLELRIKRPEKFPGNPTPSVTWREFLELRNQALGEKKSILGISIDQLARPGELKFKAGYEALVEDIRLQCCKFGKVLKVMMPIRLDFPTASSANIKIVVPSVEEANSIQIGLSKSTFAGVELLVSINEHEDGITASSDFWKS